MKKSIKAIAAFTAALTMAISCVPTIYAADDVPAVQEEAETEAKTGFEFTVGKTVDAPYNGIAKVADEEGNVYYQGYDSKNDGIIIYTLDENGSIKNSYIVKSDVNENGEKIRLGIDILKKYGDDIYLILPEYFGFSVRGHIIVKLDKELNEIYKNKFSKSEYLDTNGEKIVYMTKNNRTIYSMDMDGKNKQVLYTVEQDRPLDVLNFLAITGDYVGFQKNEGGSVPKDCKDYCGIIDLKTGEVTFKEQRSVQQLYESNGKIIWYSSDSRDTSESNMITVPKGEDVTEYIIEQNKKQREYFKDGESYVLDNGKYYVLKTQSYRESHGLTIDNDGNVITYSYNNGRYDFKFYRDNKLIDTYSADLKGVCGFTANNGVLTICYDGLDDSQLGDWVTLPPNMSDAEYEEYLASTPAPKIDYTMKSVTISYK